MKDSKCNDKWSIRKQFVYTAPRRLHEIESEWGTPTQKPHIEITDIKRLSWKYYAFIVFLNKKKSRFWFIEST